MGTKNCQSGYNWPHYLGKDELRKDKGYINLTYNHIVYNVR